MINLSYVALTPDRDWTALSEGWASATGRSGEGESHTQTAPSRCPATVDPLVGDTPGILRGRDPQGECGPRAVPPRSAEPIGRAETPSQEHELATRLSYYSNRVYFAAQRPLPARARFLAYAALLVTIARFALAALSLVPQEP